MMTDVHITKLETALLEKGAKLRQLCFKQFPGAAMLSDYGHMDPFTFYSQPQIELTKVFGIQLHPHLGEILVVGKQNLPSHLLTELCRLSSDVSA
jgi:hypothetical protein